VVEAVGLGVARRERQPAADVARELARLSTLSTDLDGALAELARQLTRILRISGCAVIATVGQSEWRAFAGSVSEVNDELLALAELAEASGAPVLSGHAAGRSVATLALRDPQGSPLGRLILIDERLRLLPRRMLSWLTDLTGRLGVELSWLSVHQRIATERDQLRERAMFDPMLGILTRASFEHQLAVEVAALRQRNEPATLVVFDVRGMRDVNDRLGHRAGDRLLKHVASMLTRELRRGDLLGRYRSDRFAVALLGTSVDKALPVVERLRKALSTPLAHKGNEISPRAAAGVSPISGGADQSAACLDRAAAAAQRAKESESEVEVADASDSMAARELERDGLPAGTNLGGMYQVVHEISRGAMGVVYRAEDLGLGRPVALKTLRPDLARDENLISMFRREAATLAKLRHDNLVQVYFFGMDQEQLFFVMELVEGQSLEDLMDLAIDREEEVPIADILGFLPQIASALDTMHEARILHRDVKPANIVQDRRRQRAVLVDVGIAAGEEGGAAAGTPGFAAPEIFGGGHQGPATDVYGLAATVYAMLINDQPFGDPEQVAAMLHRQAQGPPAPVRTTRPDLPDAVDAVLARALDPNPKGRFQKASEFAAAVAGALQGAQTGSRKRASGRLPASTPRRRTTWRRTPSQTMRAADPDQPCSRGVLFRMAHPLAVGSPQTERREHPNAGGAGAAETLPGVGWMQELMAFDEDLREPLGPQGASSGWYPTQALIRLLEAASDNGLDGGDFAQALGRTSAAASFVGFYGADPSRRGLYEILDSVDLIWHRYHDWGTVEVERSLAHADIVLAGADPVHPLLCRCTVGLLDFISTSSANAGAGVDHVECRADGASRCVFRLIPGAQRARTARF
ncbi:MAG: diguanylate cyclase, partial [Deltaproteobacteria bacterium]|nr:diguanylate cyclase [Deltaproteobacteria bacterium]